MPAAEPPRLGRRVRHRLETGYHDPALLREPAARLAAGAMRQEQLSRRRRRRNGAQQRIHIEAEADRGLGLRARMVAAAAAELAAHAGGEQGEADAGVIFEAAILDRVERQMEIGD